MNKFLAAIGVFLTLGYPVTLYFLLDIGSIAELGLNEFGDFLAGVTGPIAILWLILGFFQQGLELKQNTEALHLQAAELKNSVAQQKALVDISTEQLQAGLDAMNYERDMQKRAREPNFLLKSSTGRTNEGSIQYFFFFTNVGNLATNVVPELNRPTKALSPELVPNCPNSQQITICLEFPAGEEVTQSVLTFNFMDALGMPGKTQYSLVPSGERAVKDFAVSKIES